MDDAAPGHGVRVDGPGRNRRRWSSSGSPSCPAEEFTALQWHTVERGETLQSVANKLKVRRTDLAEANYLSAKARVKPGQRLVIPRAPTTLLAAQADRPEPVVAKAAPAPPDVDAGVGADGETPGELEPDHVPRQAGRHAVVDCARLPDVGGLAANVEQAEERPPDARRQADGLHDTFGDAIAAGRPSAPGWRILRRPQAPAVAETATRVVPALRIPRQNARSAAWSGACSRARPCSRPCSAPRSPGSTAASSASRWTSPRGCRPSRSSGCPTRVCARAATGCGRRSAIPVSSSRWQHITINLAPPDVRKEGPAYDLPIALGILAATGALPSGCVHGHRRRGRALPRRRRASHRRRAARGDGRDPRGRRGRARARGERRGGGRRRRGWRCGRSRSLAEAVAALDGRRDEARRYRDGHRRRAGDRRRRGATSRTSAGRWWRGARSRWRRRAAIMCCSPGRRGRARR